MIESDYQFHSFFQHPNPCCSRLNNQNFFQTTIVAMACFYHFGILDGCNTKHNNNLKPFCSISFITATKGAHSWKLPDTSAWYTSRDYVVLISRAQVWNLRTNFAIESHHFIKKYFSRFVLRASTVYVAPNTRHCPCCKNSNFYASYHATRSSKPFSPLPPSQTKLNFFHAPRSAFIFTLLQ